MLNNKTRESWLVAAAIAWRLAVHWLAGSKQLCFVSLAFDFGFVFLFLAELSLSQTMCFLTFDLLIPPYSWVLGRVSEQLRGN